MAKDPFVPSPSPSSSPTASGAVTEQKPKDAGTPKDSDEIQFFEGTITKLVERDVEDKDGNKSKEWVEVMSDNLYPGEKLKSVVDAEKAEEKAKVAEDERVKAEERAKAAK